MIKAQVKPRVITVDFSLMPRRIRHERRLYGWEEYRYDDNAELEMDDDCGIDWREYGDK